MKSITVYDPPMCCSTGVCGPSPDQNLVRVAGDLERLAKKGVEVIRYNLSQQPSAFVGGEIGTLIKEKGILSLPITMIDDKVQLVGRYPTTEELETW
ncbi:MAG: arsenite efflux transporter metallochaperone ArsD [Firmicutes bacterium]|nr:arsenite efflux transporter metallochaperone ArsD [Bacillota bacterium]